MFDFALPARVDRFASAKCRSAIPGARGLVRDALIQCSLDPDVISIDFIGNTTLPQPDSTVALNAIVVERTGGLYHLDIVAARPLRTLEDEGLFLIGVEELGLKSQLLSSAQIMQQPRFSSCRAVWRCRSHPAPLCFRLEVLDHLESAGQLRLGRLLKMMNAGPDAGAAIFAMACANQIAVDVSELPLGPQTPVTVVRR